MAYGLQLGSWAFPKGFHVASIDMGRAIPVAKLPRADGARVLPGTLDAKKFTVRGGIVAAAISTGSGAVRAQLDALKGALAAGPQNFYTDSDRYYRNAQAQNYSDSYDPTDFNRVCTVQFDLVTGDPFSYEVAQQNPTTAITSSGQTLSAPNGGNAYAAPFFEITMGTTGTIAATITNTTTGESFTLGGAVNLGQVFIVDCLDETVTIGGVDHMAQFEGVFPRLAPGANTISETYTSGSISALALSYHQRWY